MKKEESFNKGIALIALVITILFSYDEKLNTKSSFFKFVMKNLEINDIMLINKNE